MSEQLELAFCDESTSSAEDSHASPSASQERGLRKQMSDGSGRKSSALWASSRRGLSSSRTCLDSFGGAWQTLSPGSTDSVTRWSGPDSRLVTSARLTSESGSFSLPTLTAQSYGTSNNGCPGDGREAFKGKGKPSLNTMATKALWPTPTVKGNYNKVGLSARSGDGLATAVAKAEGKMYPTPTARDWKSGASNQHGKNALPLNEVVHITQPGPLNPKWVAWLMGFHIEWISSVLLETPSSLKSRK